MALDCRLAVLAFATLVAGCAAPPMQSVPSSATPPSYSIGPNPVVAKDFNHMTRALDDRDSVIYLQSFGGGGAAVGVLLGPLGVAANMSMIEKVTDADVALLRGRIPVDPQTVFAEVSRELPPFTSAPASSRSVLVTPLLNVVKQENEDLLFGCTLLVDYGPTGTAWVGKYVYQLPLRYPKDVVAKGLGTERQSELLRELQRGFRTLAKLYLDDAAGRLPRGGDVKFRSTFVQPRLDFELTGKQLPAEGDRLNVWLGYAGVYSLPRDPSRIKTTAPAPVGAQPAAAPQPKIAMASPAAAGRAKAIPTDFVSTPLPDDVVVSAQGSKLTGVWTGKWGSDLDITLIVEEVNGHTARVVYSWGISQRVQGPDKPGFQRVNAEVVDDGGLRLALQNGAMATYRLSADGRSLTGHYSRNRYRADGTFERRELP